MIEVVLTDLAGLMPLAFPGTFHHGRAKREEDVMAITREDRFEVQAEVPSDPAADRCNLAKSAYNGATRGKRAYFWLSFVLAVVLAAAAVYAIIAFKDEEGARGFLALIVAVGSLITTGVFYTLWKQASDDADKMWARVERYCD